MRMAVTSPQATAEMLERLVAFDTVSARSNLPLIDYAENFAGMNGAEVDRIWSENENKAGLWITVGPKDVPGYVLSGHSDVVPVEGQTWTSDPFRLTEKNGRLYGRGTSDMKGFVAVCMALLPEMATAPLARPIHIALSYDEEVGCLGVRPLIARMRERGVRPLGCFVGEPTEMEVVVGHKSKCAARVTFHGRSCHSAMAPHGVNAVEFAARFIDHVRVSAEHFAQAGARDPLYDVPHTTGLCSVVRGGTALNIVPDSCVVEFEYRAIAADDASALVRSATAFATDVLGAEMASRGSACGVTIEPLTEYPGLEIDAQSDLVKMAKRLSVREGHAKVSFGTEAGLFQASGDVPSVVVGPGAMARAHKADEYVLQSELDECASFVRRLIAESS